MAAKKNTKSAADPAEVNGKITTKEMVQSSHHKPPHPTGAYTSPGVGDYNIFNLKSGDWTLLAVITAVAVVVRLFRIYQPSSVVFDEVHFGGFASKYIKGKFFMDVHPPLAKLLITLAGYLGGYDGVFDFKDIGMDYLEPNVPYVSMRLLSAICGVLAIPTMFLTLKASGCRNTTAALGAGLLTFENGFVTQSRLILLDAPLVIFTALTALSWISFTNQHEQGPSKAFTASWWFWLAFTGLSLGATASVKWVGLFTIAWVGSLTALQLWVLIGDAKNVTVRLWFKHLFARIFCLIVIPVTFYMAMFAIHFVCLVNPGDGDGFMSSEFQSTLNSKGMADVPADVAFGARISIRHHNTQGGYLHSHLHMYPTGSKQQQITLYPHKDENNVFLVENQTQPINWAVDPTGNTSFPGPSAWDDLEPSWVVDGSIIRLYHIVTDRRVHSHDVRPPISEVEWQNEVSAYGYEGFEGDANDLFRVNIIKSLSDGKEAKERVRTIQTKFQLVHIMTGCTLFSHKVKLPDWGFEQQEVTCARGGTLPNSIWYIESNEHPSLPKEAEKVNYRNPGFFGKFWELQQVMWTTNAGLVESHAWDSRPPSWPLLSRGINFWGKDHRQIYLIGNPLIWWSSTAAIAAYVLFKGLAVLRWQRQCNDYESATFRRFDYEAGTTVLGWAFHYFPFYLMQRQLFLHHYFPALYFAIMVLCQIFDFTFSRASIGGFTLRNKPIAAQTIAVLFLAASIAVFTLYAPLSYGGTWTKAECARVKLFENWDWDCNNFLDSHADYSLYVPAAAGVAPTNAAQGGPAPPVAEDPQKEVNLTPLGSADIPAEPLISTSSTETIPSAVQGKLDKFLQDIQDKVQPAADVHNAGLAAAEDEAAAESFSTRYETHTRILDAEGRAIYDGPVFVEVSDDGSQQLDVEADTAGVAGTVAHAPEPETAADAAAAAPSDVPAEVVIPQDEKTGAKEAATGKISLEPEEKVLKAEATGAGKEEL